MISIKKINVVLATLMIVAMNSVLVGMDYEGYGYEFGKRPYRGLDSNVSAKMTRAASLNVMSHRIEKAEENLAKEIEGSAKYLRDKDALDSLKEQYNNILTNKSTAGSFFFRGFVGKEAIQFDDSEISGVSDAVIKALTVRASAAAGDVLGKRLESACETVLGGACDQVLEFLMYHWNRMNNVVFHGAHKPVTQKELHVWESLIEGVFSSLEMMLKDSFVGASRSTDMSRRRFDLGAMAGDANEDQEKPEEEDTRESAWAFLVSGYTDQLNRLSIEIESRKAYYGQQSLEHFYIEQIRGRLLKFSAFLTESSSISDLSTRLDSNKAIVPAIKSNIVDMIFQLDQLISNPLKKDDKDNVYGRKRVNATNRRTPLGSNYPNSMMSEPNRY